ncbi:hypothetical protein [Haladaptatus sp. DFWS20]|uniref:hypothetical protein n=1 Tax=Haladaptatus sp. DFWS20 TaxID=3403467 RepID=UPI003EBE2F4A
MRQQARGERDFAETANASSAERSSADSRAAAPRNDGATASHRRGPAEYHAKDD